MDSQPLKSQSREIRASFVKCVLATGLVLAALVPTVLLAPIRDHIPFALFFAAISISSWYCGKRVGFYSIFLSVLLTDIFIFEPRGEFSVKLDNLLQLFVLASVASFINWLIAKLHKSEETLLKLHGDLEQRVQETTIHLKATGDNLKKNTDGLRAFTDNVVDYAIFMLDPEGNVLSWNLGAERIKGYKSDEIVGKHISQFYSPEDVEAQKPQHLLKEAEKAGRVESEGWRIRKDGTRFWANVIITALKDEAGKVRGFVKITRDLTERLKAEEIQRTLVSQKKVSAVLESITDGFLALDSNWNITYFNPEAERIHKMSRNDVLGKTFWEIFPAVRGTNIENEYRRAVAQQTAVDFEHFYEPYSKWFAIKAYPTKESGLSVYFRDISSQKHAQADLQAQSERLRVTLLSIGDAVIVTDTASRVVSLNPISQSLTGWTDQEAHGRSLDEVFNIVNEQSRKRVENPAKRALREGTIVGLANHTILISKNGTESPIDDSAAPIKDEAGHVLGVVLVFRDVTERKKTEEERTRLLEREQYARRNAENANRLKDEFLAIISHELRTPLTPILGWTKLLRSGLNAEALEKGVQIIERNVHLQIQVIDDLLDVSRIISGKLHLNLRRLELSEIVNAAIETVRPAAQAKQIAIKTELDPGADAIMGDSTRLQQVIWNLLGNAIKFTPKNGEIHLRLEVIDSQAEITVKDNGEGIDPQFLPHIFNRFAQADTSSTRSHGGLGLGLSIAQHIIEAHGGTITAASEGKGRGATFKVRMPIKSVQWRDDKDLTITPAPGALQISTSIEGISILVVEDDDDSMQFIAAALKGAGAIVSCAASALAAREALALGKPDVIVSDIGMPEEDGYAFIRKLRHSSPELGSQIPAIALTAFAKAEDRIKAFSAGFQMHLTKPIDPTELVAVVSAVAKRTRSK